MPPKAGKGGMEPPAASGKGKGGGSGRGKGAGRGKGGAAAGSDAAKRLSELDETSIEAESNIEILRAQRAAARRGTTSVRDSVRDNEGVDEEDPLISIDAGIRLEPFNMRREMAEGHFDEGGFYILNKDEEKEVTDAWLDTVDQAEKTATFRKEEAQKKAGKTTATRLTSIAAHLKEGGDDDEEKDEDEEKKEGEEEEGGDKKEGEEGADKIAEDKEKEAPVEVEKKPEEEEEDTADEISMLEELITQLMPLETPLQALNRLAKKATASGGRAGKQAAGGPPALKMRSRVKQARVSAAEEERSAKVARTAEAQSAEANKSKKRRLTEWGWDDAKDSEAPAAKVVASGDSAATDADGKKLSAEDAAKLADGSTSTITSLAEVAAAAERAAAKEKADKEAAAAFAAEMKQTKQTVHLGLDLLAGPEAAALLNLNADDNKAAADTKKDEVDEEKAGGAAPGPGERRGKQADPAELERREKINKLTDLCDSLLQKGVNVYDSTRELLAIDVRERKGESLVAPAGEEGDGTPAGDQGKAGEAAAADAGKKDGAPELLFDNRRCSGLPSGQSAVVDAENFTAGSAPQTDQQLFWHFRWKATPADIHGPFDTVTMQGWMTQGCFAEERPAEIRQCDANNNPQEQCWHSWEKLDFELYL